jgi:hypothetical protein
MERSKREQLLPARGTVEVETQRRARVANAIKSVIADLPKRHTQEPFPAMSDHYNPETYGAEPAEPPVEHPRLFGFNANGDYVDL